MKTLGAKLKQARITAQISIEEISSELMSRGHKASIKTIYSWENSNSQPVPDALLYMCARYGITDPIIYFGYEEFADSITPVENEIEPPTVSDETESDPRFKVLKKNYSQMSENGKIALVQQSEIMVLSGLYNEHSKIPDIKQA